jgi:hypothetical protein
MVKSFLMILLIITFLLSNSCKKDTSSLGSEIHPVGSIEGISLGASKQEVEEVLGEFEFRAIADGYARNWFTVNFFGAGNNGIDGLTLSFIESTPNEAGPLDMFSMAAPYEGKTEAGIGVGSSVESVHEAYGEPTKIIDKSNGIEYIYCYNLGHHFIGVTFIDGSARRIDIGYYEPMPSGRGACDK